MVHLKHTRICKRWSIRLFCVQQSIIYINPSCSFPTSYIPQIAGALRTASVPIYSSKCIIDPMQCVCDAFVAYGQMYSISRQSQNVHNRTVAYTTLYLYHTYNLYRFPHASDIIRAFVDPQNLRVYRDDFAKYTIREVRFDAVDGTPHISIIAFRLFVGGYIMGLKYRFDVVICSYALSTTDI